jgi:hypothetical protein
MAMVIGIVAWLLVAVLVTLVLALMMPVHVVLTVLKEEQWRLTGYVQPFGRFGPRIAISKPHRKAKTASTVAGNERKKRRKWTRKPHGIATSAMRLIADLIQCVRLNAASVDLTFGLTDPSETGQVFGMMTPLIYAPSGRDRVHFNVEPVFDRAMMRGRMTVDLSFLPFAF